MLRSRGSYRRLALDARTASTRRKAKVRMEACHTKHRRLALEGVCGVDGERIETTVGVRDCVAAEWGPAVDRVGSRRVGPEALAVAGGSSCDSGVFAWARFAAILLRSGGDRYGRLFTGVPPPVSCLFRAAQVGVLRWHVVLAGVCRMVEQAASSDDVGMEPRRPWHDVSAIWILPHVHMDARPAPRHSRHTSVQTVSAGCRYCKGRSTRLERRMPR